MSATQRASLEAMRLMVLHRVLAEGLGEDRVDACMDSGDAKSALVELLLAAEAQPSSRQWPRRRPRAL